MLKAGDKVVRIAPEHSNCPNADSHIINQRKKGVPPQTVVGRAYTVKAVIYHGLGRDGVGLLLKEVAPQSTAGFCLGSFRKVEPAEPSFIERYLRPKVDA